ncbi:hypothetical protein HK097_001423, partial [Rhizophlyctis rosea]
KSWVKLGIEEEVSSGEDVDGVGAVEGRPPVVPAPWIGVGQHGSRPSLRDIMTETQTSAKQKSRAVPVAAPSFAGVERRASAVGVGSPAKNAWPSLVAAPTPSPTKSPTPIARQLNPSAAAFNPLPTTSASPIPQPQRTSQMSIALAGTPPTPSPKKLSQKDRKRLALQSSSSPGITSTPTTITPDKPSSPWAKVTLPPTGFDLTGIDSPKSKPPTISSFDQHRDPPPSKAPSSIFSRVKSTAGSSPNGSGSGSGAPSLQSIQAEQLHYQQAREKMVKKPLWRIQVEEEAKKEIGRFYGMTRGRGTGEWVVVEGV